MTEPRPSPDKSSSTIPNRAMFQPPSQTLSATPPPTLQPPPITLNPPPQQPQQQQGKDSSAPRPTPIPRSVFSSLRPPRSSSLLTSSAASRPRSPSPSPLPGLVAGPASHVAHRDNSRPPVSLKRPTTPSSEIEKINSSGLSPREGSRARNRWSTSTISSTSSRTSPFTVPQTGASPNRRASLEVTALHGSPPPAQQSSHQPHLEQLPPVMHANHSTNVPQLELRPATAQGVSQPAMRYHDANHQRGVSPSPSRSRSAKSHDLFPKSGHSREYSGHSGNDLGKSTTQKPPSQKTMLSKALQRANTAVQLDNAQNFEGAREAYAEACNLLQQVLSRTMVDEDQRKLELIRQTYTSRIDELDQMGPWQDDSLKALPARPTSEEYIREAFAYQQYFESNGEASTADAARKLSLPEGDNGHLHGHYTRMQTQHRRPSNGYLRERSSERPHTSQTHYDRRFLQSSFSRSASGQRSREDLFKHSDDLAPPPLASLRSISPVRTRSDDMYDTALVDTSNPVGGHALTRSNEDTGVGDHEESGPSSWLDPIDESGGSARTSMHSRTSSLGYRRRHIRAASGTTEAEFESALDAAIEAAYDEGYEPMGPEDYASLDASEEPAFNVLRKIELARGIGGQTKLETQGESEKEKERKKDKEKGQKAAQDGQGGANAEGGFYDGDDSSDEERILEEITRDFAIEDFTMGQQLRPLKEGWRNALETGFASEFRPLTPLSEVSPLSERGEGRGGGGGGGGGGERRGHVSSLSKSNLPSMPPPAHSLPDLPPLASLSPTSAPNARLRPVHGQKVKQLKIETTNLEFPPKKAMTTESVPAAMEEKSSSALSSSSSSTPPSSLPPPGPPPLPPASTEVKVERPKAGSLPCIKTTEIEENPAVLPASPSIHRLRKNFSSSSLRSVKSRNMSLSNLDEGSDRSPDTPSSSSFHKLPAVPALPSSLSAPLKDSAEVHVFDDAQAALSDVPVPLEPCPNDFMLRPFWLMRCLFQTLVHPRGGYLSTKLFVPRDVWRVKGVKLKHVEEKMAQCDLLTAALLKLAKVDALDADALLVEMQDLESVLEQAQAALSRKLGSEVGPQGSGLFSKDGTMVADNDGGDGKVPRAGSMSGKASSFSWRRLRSKPSAGGLGGSFAGRVGSEVPIVPMTAKPTTRPARRDLRLAQFVGPNAHYMASLAHLFDAAQAIDQIARQVEDPGLRHADKTQVGLELCTRHAAEFFGFYICRFALADVGLLLDKFIKRGSEWVLQ